MGSDLRDRELSIALFDGAKAFESDSQRFAEAICGRIDEAIDEFDHTSPLTVQGIAATRSSILAFCALLRADGPLEVHAPAEAAALVRAYVRRRIPLKVVLRAYQIGHAELWRAWMQIVHAGGHDPATEVDLLDDSSVVLFRFMDRLTTEVIEAYEREHSQWTRSTTAVREEAVRAVLAEQPLVIEDVQRDLGHDVRAMQVGVVLWSTGQATPAETLQGAWRDLSNRGPSHSSTAVMAGSRVLWGWLAIDAEQVEEAVAALAAWQPDAGLGAAIGEPAAGLAGFRISHYQALQARRVAEAGAEPPAGMVAYSDVAVPALITADPLLGLAFVRRELGPLAEETGVAVRLRETLAAYFAEGESPAATGRRLDVHVNTVLYRLRQVEELLGFAPATRRLELQLALLLKPFVDGD